MTTTKGRYIQPYELEISKSVSQEVTIDPEKRFQWVGRGRNHMALGLNGRTANRILSKKTMHAIFLTHSLLIGRTYCLSFSVYERTKWNNRVSQSSLFLFQKIPVSPPE